MADILAAVDLTGIIAFVIAAGILIVGITMGFKGVDLSKRVIKKT